MNLRTKILSAALALAAAAPAAQAQSPRHSYDTRAGYRALSLSFATPYLARRYPLAPRRVWIPGHRERVLRRIWVEGERVRRWSPPAYETAHDDCGRPIPVLVSPGHWTLVQEQGHFESRRVEVWVDGHWRIGR